MDNHESIGGDKSDDLERFYAEFAELDAELDRMSANVLPRHPSEQFSLVRSQLLQLLEASGITRVIDEDETKERALFTQFVETQKRQIQEYTQWTRESFSVGRVTLESLVKYYDEREFEDLVLNSVSILLCHQRYPDDWVDDELDLGTAKKELQAMLIICYGRGNEDEWYKFIDETVPGEGLNPLSYEGQVYLEEGWKMRAGFDQDTAKRQVVLEQLCMLAGVDLDGDDPAEIAETVSVLINMRIIAEMPIAHLEERLFRNSLLLQRGQELDLEGDVLMDIIDFLDDSYPVDDGLDDDYS